MLDQMSTYGCDVDIPNFETIKLKDVLQQIKQTYIERENLHLELQQDKHVTKQYEHGQKMFLLTLLINVILFCVSIAC
jgi:hypothetical protein